MGEKTFKFQLARQAKSQGGDRYESPVDGEQKPWALYVPQSVCRNDTGKPAVALDITIKA